MEPWPPALFQAKNRFAHVYVLAPACSSRIHTHTHKTLPHTTFVLIDPPPPPLSLENTFLGTSLHFFWTWTLLLDLTTFGDGWTCTPSCWTSSFLPARPGLFPNHTPLDRFSRFCPAASASKILQTVGR